MKPAILLENATVIDGAGTALFAASVLIEDDRIAAVGQQAKDRVAHLQQGDGPFPSCAAQADSRLDHAVDGVSAQARLCAGRVLRPDAIELTAQQD